MSTVNSQVRTRLPRFNDSAALRSRLALVPPRLATARRTPFVVLIGVVLVGGVVGLLLFNTQMQQDAFRATALQQQATALSAQQQSLDMALQRLRDPQALAVRARSLGMVVPADPTFLRLSDGKILGTPLAATSADAMRVNGYPAIKPAQLAPPPKIVHVTAPVTPSTPSTTQKSSSTTQKSSTTTQKSSSTGAASAKSTPGHGRKKGH